MARRVRGGGEPGLRPARDLRYSWSVALSRLIASVFFIRVVVFNATSWTEKPEAFLPLLVSDTTIGLVSACLLYLGFRQEHRERPGTASAPPRGSGWSPS